MAVSALDSRYECLEVNADISSARFRIRDSVLFEFCVEKLPVDVEQASRLSAIAVGFSERLYEQKFLEPTDRRMEIQFQ
jgi:hypothetical protein